MNRWKLFNYICKKNNFNLYL